MRVDLAHDSKVDVEMEVKSFDRDVGPQAPVFPLVAKGVWHQIPLPRLHHEDDGIQDARNGRGGYDSGPNDTVRTGEIVAQDGGRMRIRGHARNVEDAAGALVCFAEGHRAPCPPAA